MTKISVVIPCYYNANTIPSLTGALIENERLFGAEVEFEYLLIDDDSGDRTWEKLKDFKANFPDKVTIIKLHRNVGSYNAIYPGLKRATGDCTIVMAADLQDPPAHISILYEQWKSGNKLVLANRENDAAMSSLYFGFLRVFGLKDLPKGGFDFCLFDKALRDGLIQFKNNGANSLYQLLNMGEPPTLEPYVKRKRPSGRSRWTTWKKIKLALNTIERYSKFRMVHASLLSLSVSAIGLSVYTLVGSGSILVLAMIVFMLVAIFIEILRTIIRDTQHDLTNIVRETV